MAPYTLRKCIDAPAIRGMVILSSGGNPNSSTSAATNAPINSPQWKSLAPPPTNIATITKDTARKAAAPPGDLPNNLGPGIRRPTSAAAGSPAARNNSAGTATSGPKNRNVNRRPNDQVGGPSEAVTLIVFQQRSQAAQKLPVQPRYTEPDQIQAQSPGRHHG